MIDAQDPCETCGRKIVTHRGTCAHEWRAESLFGCAVYQLADDEYSARLGNAAPTTADVETTEGYPF